MWAVPSHFEDLEEMTFSRDVGRRWALADNMSPMVLHGAGTSAPSDGLAVPEANQSAGRDSGKGSAVMRTSKTRDG